MSQEVTPPITTHRRTPHTITTLSTPSCESTPSKTVAKQRDYRRICILSMPTPSSTARTHTTTLPILPQIAQQSNLDGFVRLTRPQIESNDQNGSEANQNANITPLLRNRRIRDDDDDDDAPMVNRTLPNSVVNPVVIGDTENESDANFAVVLLPQRRSSHDPSAEDSRPRQPQFRRTQSPAPAEFAETARPV